MGSILSSILSSILTSTYIDISYKSFAFGINRGDIAELHADRFTGFLAPLGSGSSGVNSAADVNDMGFSFRFGYKEWFEFGFRLGPRKSAQKSDGKELIIHTGYNVKMHGSLGRRVELKDDVVS